MELSERIGKFVFQIRGMWKAAGLIFEAQRNVLDMTIGLANEIERRIKLEAENNELGKALGYYKTGVQQTSRNCKKPEYVPKRIVLIKTIRSDLPFSNHLCAKPGEYIAHCNQYGAVSLRTLGGELLGVKLDEFDVIEWQENPALLAEKDTP